MKWVGGWGVGGRILCGRDATSGQIMHPHTHTRMYMRLHIHMTVHLHTHIYIHVCISTSTHSQDTSYIHAYNPTNKQSNHRVISGMLAMNPPYRNCMTCLDTALMDGICSSQRVRYSSVSRSWRWKGFSAASLGLWKEHGRVYRIIREHHHHTHAYTISLPLCLYLPYHHPHSHMYMLTLHEYPSSLLTCGRKPGSREWLRLSSRRPPEWPPHTARCRQTCR